MREKLVSASGQSERAALQARVGELASTPLDPARPLWQFHLIDGYEGGSALIARVHHCIGDGIALISVMMTITDGGSDPPRRERRAAAPTTAATGSPTRCSSRSAASRPRRPRSPRRRSRARSSCSPIRSRASPAPIAGARLGAKVLGDVAAMALMADDSPTLLKGKPSGDKRVAWGEPIALAAGQGDRQGARLLDQRRAARLRRRRDRRLAARRRATIPRGKEIRAMVPVNLRPLDQAWQLGNRFGLAPLVLPIGIDNPVERVYAVRARMNELKASYQPLLAFAVLAVAGQMVQAGAGRDPRPVREEGDGGDDQRARARPCRSRSAARPCARRCSGCRRRATSASASASCRTAAACSSA